MKTVAVVLLSHNGDAPDTLDYTELDRAGYPVLTSKPNFKARSHLAYNSRHQLISYTKEAEPGFPLVVQTVFDPATKTTTTRVGPTLATLALYQTGHASQHGKASEYETFLLAVPQLPAPTVSRILLRITVVGGDTLRQDVLGYYDEQMVEHKSYYSIGRAPQQRENGIIAPPAVGRANQPWAGHYIPGQRHTYNAAGWLVRTQYLPTPPPLADKPVTQASADGHGSMTIKSLADTLTTTYLRNADGQLLRQEYRGGFYTRREVVCDLGLKIVQWK